jgi:hypothetical protein
VDNDKVKMTLEIRDQEIAEELINRVEEGIRLRRQQSARTGETSGNTLNPMLADDRKMRVHYTLEQADFSASNVKIDLELRVARTLVDRVLARVRAPFHDLVLFYIGLMAAKQRVFNSYAISALRLTYEIVQRNSSDARSKEVEELRIEVAQLRTQIEQLENALAQAAKKLAEEEKDAAPSTTEEAKLIG